MNETGLARAWSDELTVNDEASGAYGRCEAGDRDETRHAAAVVVGASHEAMRPAFGGVVHHTHTASAAQPRHVRHAELRADVATTEEDLHVRRRVSAERDAPQDARDRLDERQRTVRVGVAVSRLNSVRFAMINLRAVVVDKNDVTHRRCNQYRTIIPPRP